MRIFTIPEECRHNHLTRTAQKVKVSVKDFFSKSDQIRMKLRIWSHLLKKSLIVNFIFVQCFMAEEMRGKLDISTFERVSCRQLFLEQKFQQCQKKFMPPGHRT